MLILVINLILFILEATEGRQRFFDMSSMPYGHRVGTNKIRTYPPIATVFIEFFCSMVCVVHVRLFVHLANHFFSATQFDHGLSESCITNESIVNTQEFSFLAFLLELVRSVIFMIPFFLSVPVTVSSTFPDVEVRKRLEVVGVGLITCVGVGLV